MEHSKHLTVTFINGRLNGTTVKDVINEYTKLGEIKIINESAYFITTTMSSELATLLKLKDAGLAARMRISYIADELKDKYRSRPGPATL